MDIHNSDSFKKSQNKAKQTMSSTSKTSDLIKRVMEKSDGKEGFFDVIWDDLQTLVKMVRSWNRGDYRDISQKTIMIVVASLIYFVSPIDVIPDIIPFLGWADDLTLLGYVIKTVRGEIDRYRIWEKSGIVNIRTEEI